jgi:hypothetical protein
MALAPRTDNPAKDMARVMAIVREYSDARLADVLAGKDMSVPQFAAMTEAMGRKQLRQAVDGQQAQQQAQQPSIKDQLLAEQSAPQMAAGIDQLAAPNMESIDMAGGGIIAFSGKDGSQVQLSDEEYDRQKRQSDMWKRVREENQASNSWIERNLFGKGIPGLFERKKQQEIYNTPITVPPTFNPEDPYNKANAAPVENVTDNAAPAALDPSAAPAAPTPAPAASPKSVIDVSQPTKFERRSSPFGEMSAEKVDIEGLKSRGLGEGLMRLSAGLLSAPGAKGFSAGVAALAEQAGLTRKETNALKKDARDYDFNIKRAEAAFEQGQDELGLKFTEAANLNKYRMASLAQEPGELRTLRAIEANPALAALYKGANKGEMLTVKDATTAFNDIVEKNPKYARELAGLGIKDPMAYRQFVITGLPPMQVVGTLGEGAKVRS